MDFEEKKEQKTEWKINDDPFDVEITLNAKNITYL